MQLVDKKKVKKIGEVVYTKKLKRCQANVDKNEKCFSSIKKRERIVLYLRL